MLQAINESKSVEIFQFWQKERPSFSSENGYFIDFMILNALSDWQN